MSEVSECLRRAANRVLKGWCQLEDEDAKGNVCARQAIFYASGALGTKAKLALEAQNAFRAYLIAHGLLRNSLISSFNDEPKQTAENVAFHLNECAKELER